MELLFWSKVYKGKMLSGSKDSVLFPVPASLYMLFVNIFFFQMVYIVWFTRREHFIWSKTNLPQSLSLIGNKRPSLCEDCLVTAFHHQSHSLLPHTVHTQVEAFTHYQTVTLSPHPFLKQRVSIYICILKTKQHIKSSYFYKKHRIDILLSESETFLAIEN